MGSISVSWLVIFTVTFLFINLSEAKHGKKLPTAVVVGTVYCDTCFQQDFSMTSHFISGASVAVKCDNRNSKRGFYQEVKTNENGVFEVHLPTAVSKHVMRIKECSVRLIHSSEPFCAVASSATSSSLHLKARKEGTHIFSAGFFTFKPLKEPEICNQKPTVPISKTFSSNKAFSFSFDIITSPLTNPNPTPLLGFLPPLPAMPVMPSLPALPTLPALPQLPALPAFGQQPKVPVPEAIENSKRSILSDQKTFQPTTLFPPIIPPILPTPPPSFGGIPLPPNPFQPAPLLPNPLQPPPTFGIPGFPPLLPTPPPAFRFPGIPPVLPTPPPAFGIPGIPPILPTLPPGFPGIPPASSSKKASP